MTMSKAHGAALPGLRSKSVPAGDRERVPIARYDAETRVRRSGDDRGAHVLVLTEEGRLRMETARAARRRQCQALFGTWATEDVQALADMLTRLNQTA